MGISNFLNPKAISADKEYIGVDNLKQDVLDLIESSSASANYDDEIEELHQKIDTNVDRIDSEMSRKENYPIDINYNDLVTLALAKELMPGQKYIIGDYKTVISQSNISVVDSFVIQDTSSRESYLTQMGINTEIIVEADTPSTLKEDARLVRHFHYTDSTNNPVMFSRSYDVKYDLHPTGLLDSAKVGFVPSGQFVTLNSSIMPDVRAELEENCVVMEYITSKSYYCTDYTVNAYDDRKVLSKFLQFTNGTDNVYVRMPSDTENYPEITDGMPIYRFNNAGTSQTEDDTCTQIGTNVVHQYTGYVYHMKDEFDNEADYEFDLILKYNNFFAFGSKRFPLMYSIRCRGLYKNNKIYGLYKDTLIRIDYNTIESNGLLTFVNNIISENCDNCSIICGGRVTDNLITNNFIGEHCINVIIADSSNVNIGSNSIDVQMYFSDENVIGPYSSIIDISKSSYNTLGKNSGGITLIDSLSNVIGNSSQNIVLINSYENRFECSCRSINLESSSFNTFGMRCQDIFFEGKFENNRIGNNVTGIRFKTSASLNAGGLTNIRNANIDDNVNGLVLYGRPLSSGSTSYYQNFNITKGVCGNNGIRDPEYVELPSTLIDSRSVTYITKDKSSGNVVIYNDGEVVNKLHEIGDITALTTRDRTSVVAAVNEVNKTLNSFITSGAGGTGQSSDNLPTFDVYHSDDMSFDYKDLLIEASTEPSRDEYNIVFISGLDTRPLNRFFYVHKSAQLIPGSTNGDTVYKFSLPRGITADLGYSQSPLLNLYYNDSDTNFVYNNRMYKLTSDGSYYISTRNTLIPLNEIVDFDYLSSILNDIQLNLEGIVKPTKYFPHYTAEIETFELVNLDGSNGGVSVAPRPVVHTVEDGIRIADYDEVLFVSNPSYGATGFPNGHAGFYARRKAAPFEYFSCWRENGKFLGSEHYNGSSLNLVDPAAGTYPIVRPNVYFDESTEELMSIINDSAGGLVRLPLSLILTNIQMEINSLKTTHKTDITGLRDELMGIQTLIDRQLMPIVEQFPTLSSTVEQISITVPSLKNNVKKLSEQLSSVSLKITTIEKDYNQFKTVTNNQLGTLETSVRSTNEIVTRHSTEINNLSGRIDALKDDLENTEAEIYEYVNDEIGKLTKIKYFSSYNNFANAQKQPGVLYVIGCN